MAHDHRTVTPAPFLAERCKEVLGWHKTGLLNGGSGGRLRELANDIKAQFGIMYHDALSLAEKRTADEAMAFVAACSAASARMEEAPSTLPVVPNSVEAKSEVAG